MANMKVSVDLVEDVVGDEGEAANSSSFRLRFQILRWSLFRILRWAHLHLGSDCKRVRVGHI